MSALAMRERARAVAEALMIDTVRISRATDDTYDPGTKLITAGTPTTIYDGPGRLRMPTTTETESIFGERQVTKQRFMVDVPHGTTGVAVGDVVAVASSDDASALIREFQVIAVPSETYNMYRPIGCETVE